MRHGFPHFPLKQLSFRDLVRKSAADLRCIVSESSVSNTPSSVSLSPFLSLPSLAPLPELKHERQTLIIVTLFTRDSSQPLNMSKVQRSKVHAFFPPLDILYVPLPASISTLPVSPHSARERNCEWTALHLVSILALATALSLGSAFTLTPKKKSESESYSIFMQGCVSVI